MKNTHSPLTYFCNFIKTESPTRRHKLSSEEEADPTSSPSSKASEKRLE